MSCDHAEQDGSYVLGALSPADRLAFERHLPDCTDCARGVRELAGLPGLLDRVDPGVLDERDEEEPLPDTLLPTLLHRVRREGRRRVVAGVAVAVAAGVAAIVLGVGLAHRDQAPSTTVATPTRAMVAVGHVPVRASLAMHDVAWGTRLDLACTYAPGAERYRLPPSVRYVLVVRTRSGAIERVGTWRSLQGRTMRLSAATATPRRDIASVEVRTLQGRAVLQLHA